MAEATEEMSDMEEAIEKEVENKDEDNPSMLTSESFLAQLNLVMVMACLTLSTEELLQFEEAETISAKEQEIKTVVSKLQSRKRELQDFKVVERRPSTGEDSELEASIPVLRSLTRPASFQLQPFWLVTTTQECFPATD